MNPIKASKIAMSHKQKWVKKKLVEEPIHSWPFKLTRQDESVEENIYIKDHINIIKHSEDATDI